MTAEPREFPRTEEFLGAYFHQDWDLDDRTFEDVVDRFTESEPETWRAGVEVELDELLRRSLDEEALGQLLRKMGSSFHPPGVGLSRTEWLRAMRRRLARPAMIELEVRAATFGSHEDLAARVLVLSEGEHGEGRRLELQRPLDPTEDDRRVGMDTHCLVNEAGAISYGGVTAWWFDGATLRLELTPEAADVLAADGGYLITLAGPAVEAREAVRRGLVAILGSAGDALGAA